MPSFFSYLHTSKSPSVILAVFGIAMLSKSTVLVASIALQLPWAALAAPPNFLEARAGAVCSSGIYGELAPILSGYPIAQAFCTAVYPVHCTTAKQKRQATTPRPTPSSTTTTTTKPPTTVSSEHVILDDCQLISSRPPRQNHQLPYVVARILWPDDSI